MLKDGFKYISLDFYFVNNKNIKTIKVPQRTLTSILEKELNSVNHIDILKIDIEGGELKCLKGLDLRKYHPKLILLENICNKDDIKKYLESHNYTLDKRITYNEFYLYNQDK